MKITPVKIILLGALLLALLSCVPPSKADDIVYENALTSVHKIKVDGILYLVVRSPNGVAITRHDTIPTWFVPSGGEAGDITIDTGKIISYQTPLNHKTK